MGVIMHSANFLIKSGNFDGLFVILAIFRQVLQNFGHQRDSVNGQGISGMGFIIKKIVVHKKSTEVREGKKTKTKKSILVLQVAQIFIIDKY